MPQLDGTGPEKKGKLTGRGLGKCKKTPDDEALQKLGKGMGLRRKSGGGEGQGNRLRSGERR
ncbi:MAG: DUF5320 family protein [Prolixibacteraceae bacterium]|jgi:hypothetical protein|nr:DUF5320 family protein [Prolixibacteraceae bacterium]